jgi:hypothetical protein
MLKSFIPAIVFAAALAAPAVSFAQSNDPVTRAQVQADLVQLEQANGRPSMNTGNDPHYPADIQADEARVAAQNDATNGYGGVASGSSDARGLAVSTADWKAMYGHH